MTCALQEPTGVEAALAQLDGVNLDSVRFTRSSNNNTRLSGTAPTTTYHLPVLGGRGMNKCQRPRA